MNTFPSVVCLRILLPLDGSDTAAQAAPFAVTQAERFRAQLCLRRAAEPILHADSLAALDDAWQERMKWVRGYLECVAASIWERGIQGKIVVTEDAPHVTITQYTETNQVGLIALCLRDRSGPSRLGLCRKSCTHRT
jgi:hypothetical protein